MFKKILITMGLTISLLLTVGGSLTKAYQIAPSYRPSNAPFGLEEEIREREASGATILILQIIAGALLYFAAPVAVIIIGIAAFNMVVGGAETDKIEQAKKNLTWSVIGLALIILSYSIVRIVLGIVISAGSAIQPLS